jgi:hypothetical protein
LIENDVDKDVLGTGDIAPSFLTSTVVASFTLRPFYPQERAPGSSMIGGCVAPRTSVGAVEIIGRGLL